MPPLLELERVTAGYGRVEVLHGLSLSVPEGCVVALLGPNGAGKTTTMRVISGTLPVRAGQVRFGDEDITTRSAYERACRGLTLVPEGRGVFPGLSVHDNLEIALRGARGVDDAWRARQRGAVLHTFPRLQERIEQRAGTLSGGEQQMLAMSRAFLANPRVLLLDEISMGLAPRIVEQLFDAVDALRRAGMTVVLVEQYLTYALRLADICYVMNKGRIDFIGEPSEIRSSGALTGYLTA
jgi:branched-chain amino acid transport system ATP-binding protein